MLKAIIFDRDGVIVDSEHVNIIAAEQAAFELGAELDDNDRRLIVGRHPADYSNLFEEKYHFSADEYYKKHREKYCKNLDSVIFFDKTISLIKRLKTKGYLLGLTTASELDNTNVILKQTGLDDVFDVVVTFEDCTRRKPYPDPYLITAKKLGVSPEECLVVEDTSVGLQSAKNAGMRCVVIPNEHTKNQDFSLADYIVESGDGVEEVILKF